MAGLESFSIWLKKERLKIERLYHLLFGLLYWIRETRYVAPCESGYIYLKTIFCIPLTESSPEKTLEQGLQVHMSHNSKVVPHLTRKRMPQFHNQGLSIVGKEGAELLSY